MQIGQTYTETTKKFLRRLLAFILKAVSQAASRLHAHEKPHEGGTCETTKEQKTAAGPGSVARSRAAGPGSAVTVATVWPYKL
jgi:hypothetical protein